MTTLVSTLLHPPASWCCTSLLTQAPPTSWMPGHASCGRVPLKVMQCAQEATGGSTALCVQTKESVCYVTDANQSRVCITDPELQTLRLARQRAADRNPDHVQHLPTLGRSSERGRGRGERKRSKEGRRTGVGGRKRRREEEGEQGQSSSSSNQHSSGGAMTTVPSALWEVKSAIMSKVCRSITPSCVLQPRKNILTSSVCVCVLVDDELTRWQHLH